MKTREKTLQYMLMNNISSIIEIAPMKTISELADMYNCSYHTMQRFLKDNRIRSSYLYYADRKKYLDEKRTHNDARLENMIGKDYIYKARYHSILGYRVNGTTVTIETNKKDIILTKKNIGKGLNQFLRIER